MSEAIQRYYLQQMGIETWALRHHQETANPIILMVLGAGGDEHRLFNKMFISIGLSAVNIYMTNALSHSELAQQLSAVKPQLIFAAGCTVGQFLLNDTGPLEALRSKRQDYQGTPVVVSFHPDDLIRNPIDKKKAYQDLLLIQDMIIPLE